MADEDLLLLAKHLFFIYAAGNTPTDEQLMRTIKAWRQEAFRQYG